MDKEMILTLKIVLILCMAIAEFGVKQSILSVLRIASEWDPMMKCTCIAGTATVLCIVKLYCNFSGVIDYVCIPQNLYVTNDFLLWHSSSFVVNGKQWFDFWCALERFYRPHRSSWDFPVQKNTGTLLYTRPEGVSPIILRAIFRIPSVFPLCLGVHSWRERWSSSMSSDAANHRPGFGSHFRAPVFRVYPGLLWNYYWWKWVASNHIELYA